MYRVVRLVVKMKVAVPAGAVISPPVRTCIACRNPDSRANLVRLTSSVAADGVPEAVVDWRSRLPGRGAWLHPTQDCLILAMKRKAITRALPGSRGIAELEAELALRLDEVVAK